MGFLGIDGSPTCGVNICGDNEPGPGLFIKILKNTLPQLKIIGINPKYYNGVNEISSLFGDNYGHY